VVETGASEEQAETYLRFLSREVDIIKANLGIHTISPRSVLIGGGTPSSLSPRLTGRLLDILASKFDLSKCTQISCEAEPGTLLGRSGAEKLSVLREHGVDRLCLGVQSFDDEALRDMGRMHTAVDAARAIEQVRRAGFESLSIDLIYGYPGCTPEKWVATLEEAFSLDIDACQLYRLRIVPHGDRTGVVKGRSEKAPESFPTLEQIFIMKELGILVAKERGLSETSRRVFSRRPDRDSEYLKDHTDRLYDVMGIGISSWTNLQGRFFLNTGQSLDKYYSLLDQGRQPIDRGKVRTTDDTLRWAVALPLKHCGVSKAGFRKLTGCSVEEAFPVQLAALGRFGLIADDQEALRLTERGRFFADEVVMQFYHPDYLPFPRSSYAEGDLNPYRYVDARAPVVHA
jgi:oxygen-independent coproporphyrinogen-3 oxidase